MSQENVEHPAKFRSSIHGRWRSLPRSSKRRNIIWSVLIFTVGAALVVAFFYWDRNNRFGRIVQSSGALGIVASILLMCLFCIIPVPGEFLLVLNMKVFGVWWGILYSWLGSMLGSIAVFLLARYIARDLLAMFVSGKQMRSVETWVGHRGVLGLILARVIPLPFIVVNYTAGIVRTVSTWNFIWTSAVGGVPYYVGAALVFLGVSKKYIVWLVLGGTALLAIWIAGYLYNRSTNKLLRGSH